jgi:hypothetical protein
MLSSDVHSSNPTMHTQAMRSSKADDWQRACDHEMSLMQHHVWDMAMPPHGTRVILSKWVFKWKLNAIGEVDRYKARLVAKGFTHRPGIDYDEVWAPVGNHTTFRALLAVAAAKGLELHQMDVKTAFLHGELEETIWMQPPESPTWSATWSAQRELLVASRSPSMASNRPRGLGTRSSSLSSARQV